MSHLENVSEEEINRLLGMVVDVENLFMSVHKEEDTDTKQVYFYLFKVRLGLGTLRRGPSASLGSGGCCPAACPLPALLGAVGCGCDPSHQPSWRPEMPTLSWERLLSWPWIPPGGRFPGKKRPCSRVAAGTFLAA